METDPLDHRWAERKAAHLDVTIRNEKTEITNCTAEDVSWGGAFIKTSETDKISQNDEVELLFHINEKGATTEYKLNAKVVRCLSEGYGFEFTRYFISTFLKLRKIIKSQKIMK